MLFRSDTKPWFSEQLGCLRLSLVGSCPANSAMGQGLPHGWGGGGRIFLSPTSPLTATLQALMLRSDVPGCLRKSGRGGEIRTHDLLYPKQARYQATLRPDPQREKLTSAARNCNLEIAENKTAGRAIPRPHWSPAPGARVSPAALERRRLRPRLRPALPGLPAPLPR